MKTPNTPSNLPNQKTPVNRVFVSDNWPKLLLTRPAQDGEPAVYQLAEDFTFEMGDESGASIKITIPKGFETDLASVVRWLWFKFPPNGPWTRAALVHDYFYRNKTPFSRFFADSVFREIMRIDGVPLWQRVVMYYAVRIFGWQYFKSTD